MRTGKLKQQHVVPVAILLLALIANIAFWLQLRDHQVQWLNVPPPPSPEFSTFIGLGDRSFSYRLNGIFIQNLGDSAGRVVHLNDYNFENLAKWFFLEDSLDKRSDFIPYISSFYFGALTDSESYRPVLDYLEQVGQRRDGEKWRWLAHAIYFYRFKLNDYNNALRLARILEDHDRQDLPTWTKMMPAYVMTQKGDKEAAFDLLIEILSSSGEKLHPNEVNATKDYICRNLLDQSDANYQKLCTDFKPAINKGE